MSAIAPVISVSILTYNQYKLIGRAIDSVLAQRVNVPIEIIVGDDCSSDGTQEVLRDYQRRYPDVIQLVLHPRRYENEVPGRTNNITNLSACRGKYTAMLDGDDYWTDPNKLQRQYDLLESRPELAMCLCNSYVVPEGKDYTKYGKKTTSLRGTIRRSGVYDHTDIARRDLEAQISTVLFRTRSIEYFPDWFREVVAADFALLMMISQTGRVYYDASPSAVYTISSANFTNTVFKSEDLTRRQLADVMRFNALFPAMRSRPEEQKNYAYLYYRLWKKELCRGNLLASIRYFRGMMARDPYYVFYAIRERFFPTSVYTVVPE